MEIEVLVKEVEARKKILFGGHFWHYKCQKGFRLAACGGCNECCWPTQPTAWGHKATFFTHATLCSTVHTLTISQTFSGLFKSFPSVESRKCHWPFRSQMVHSQNSACLAMAQIVVSLLCTLWFGERDEQPPIEGISTVDLRPRSPSHYISKYRVHITHDLDIIRIIKNN